MGRITIFTTDGSPACLDVKESFDRRSIPYEEISITQYPAKRSDLISLTESVQTPQVFFNDEHIGGLREVERILSQWETESEFSAYETVLERCEMEVLADVDTPKDERLGLPVSPNSSSTKKHNVSDLPPQIALPNGTPKSVPSVILMLTQNLPTKKKYRRLIRVHKNCFKGSAAVTVLMNVFKTKSRQEIVAWGQKLQDVGIIHSVTGQNHRFNHDSHLYRLQPLVKPKILNSFYQRHEGIDSDPLQTVQELLEMINKIILKATNPSTGTVDYASARANSTVYTEFEFAATKLQVANGIAILDQPTKLAFFLNLYNLMMKHALLKFSSFQFSRKFYRKIKYNVGGTTLSFLDIEHGILRANNKLPSKGHSRFRGKDIRSSMCVSTLDPRFHFALYRGTKFSPIGITYTKEALDDELGLTARCYFAKKDYFALDEARHEVRLPFVMREYSHDFGLMRQTADDNEAKRTMKALILPLLRGETKDRLSKLIRSDKPIRVAFSPPTTIQTNSAPPLPHSISTNKTKPSSNGTKQTQQFEHQTSLLSSFDDSARNAVDSGRQASGDRWSLAGNSWTMQSSADGDMSEMEKSTSVGSKRSGGRRRASLGRRSTNGGYGRTESLTPSLRDWLDSPDLGEIQASSPRLRDV